MRDDLEPKTLLRVAEVLPETRPVPPVKGGAIQQFVYDLALFLKEKVDITILSRPVAEQKKDILRYIPIGFGPYDKLASIILANTQVGEFVPIRILLKGIIVVSYTMRCAKHINKFDILHIHNNLNFVPILRRNNRNAVILLHMNNTHFTSKRYSKWLKPFYKMAIKDSDKIICVSQFIRDDIIRNYSEAQQKSIVIYNGVDDRKFIRKSEEENSRIRKRFGVDAKKITITFAGRLTKSKGIHTLLEALTKINRKEFQLIIAGSRSFAEPSKISNYEIKLLDMAKRLGDRVRFLGYVKPDDLAELYSISDICVVPSLPFVEGCPFVLLEAMSSSCCVITADAPPMDEIISDNINGMLFRSEDPISLAHVLDMAMDDPNLRKRLGENARKTVEEKFSHSVIFDQILELFLLEYERKRCLQK